MASYNPNPAPNGGAALTIEQFLVMHCLKDDSVLGQTGLSVRAASVEEHALLDWALKFSPYELPFDMKSGSLLSSQAPRRLARVLAPSGRIALVHSAYLPEDTRGRPHSYISHILVARELGVLEAVTAWNATDWRTDEYPRGETKVLPQLDHLPTGSLINEAALSTFLRAEASSPDQSLAKNIFPGRVQQDPESRRRWLRAGLHAYLRTGEPNTTRAQVCVLAEPGVVALLVYAVARLLPRKFTGSFLFSTYEPPHTSLRDNTSARVIGSYARNGLDRADAEALRRRCYVIDTQRGEFKPDLQFESDSWPLEDLLKLAARSPVSSDDWKKDWAEIDAIRDLWEIDPLVKEGVSLKTLAEAVRIRPQAAALNAGTLGISGLRELAASRHGGELLRRKEYRDSAWKVLRPTWMQPGLTAEFANIVGEHLDELLQEAKYQARKGSLEGWRGVWTALRNLIPAENHGAVLETLLRAQGEAANAPTLRAGDRASLLREWSEAARPGSTLPADLHWLLRSPDEPAFLELIHSLGLDPRHAGLAACLALGQPNGWQADAGNLNACSDDQFGAFAAILEQFPERAAVLAKLFPDGAPPQPARLTRFLKVQPPLSSAWLETILKPARCDEPQWLDYWLEATRFEELLSRLERGSKLADRIWNGLVNRITPQDFMRTKAARTLQTLATACTRFPDHIPSDERNRLYAWALLNRQFTDPEKGSGKAAELERACQTVRQTTEVLAEHYLRERVENEKDELQQHLRLGVLGKVLLGFYSSEDEACKAAMNLTRRVNANLAVPCKTELFNTIVSDTNWNRLVQKHSAELHGTPIKLRRTPPAASRESVRLPGKRGQSQGRPGFSPETKRTALAFGSGVLVTALAAVFWFMVVDRSPSAPEDAKEANATAEPTKPQGPPQENAAAQLFDRNASLKNENKKLLEKQKSLETELTAEKQKYQQKLDDNGKLRERLDAMTSASPPVQRTDAPASPNTPPPKERKEAAAPPPKNDQKIADALINLNNRIITYPISKAEDVDEARQLLQKLENLKPDGPALEMVAVTKPLLSGLFTKDLHELIPEQKLKPTFKEFLFLKSGDPKKTWLATLAEYGARTFYAFEIKDKALKGTVQYPSTPDNVNYDFLGSSPSGEFVLARQAKGLDVLLIKKESDLPAKGKDLIIVSELNGGLRFRMIDHDGVEKASMVVDTNEKKPEDLKKELKDRSIDAAQVQWDEKRLDDLKKRFAGLWLPHKLTISEKARVVAVVASIVDLASKPSTNLEKISSVKFYQNYIDKIKGIDHIKYEYIIPKDCRFAVSHAGDLLAIASSQSDGNKTSSSVEINALPIGVKSHKLDFKKHETDLGVSWKIADMAFSGASQILIVGFEDENFLLAFDLNAGDAFSKRISCGDKVRDWGHSADGLFLASTTQSKVFVEGIPSLFKQDSEKTIKTIIGGLKFPLSAAALNRNGTLVATGDDGGFVTIYHGEKGGFREVLRLSHSAPILKLAFSADNRVLAVLVRNQEGSDPGGFIRFWVADNWE